MTGNPGGPAYEVLCNNPASLGANRQVPVETLIPSRPFPPGFIMLAITQTYGGPAADGADAVAAPGGPLHGQVRDRPTARTC